MFPILDPRRRGPVNAMATRQIRLTTTLAAMAMVLVASIGPAKTLDKPQAASLLVTPLTVITFSGSPGGPFSPSSFDFHVSASTGTVNYAIRTPSWLTASSSLGTAGTSGVTITVTINSTAHRLPPGSYGPGVVFINATNGQGSTTRSTRLIIRPPSPPSPPSTAHVPDASKGYLRDNGPGHLLDRRGGKLLPQ
jgi:hypothetical protein